jgi:integrase
MIVNLNTVVPDGLICPPGKGRRIEYVDKGGTGLYVEVRATSQGEGTYYLRYKDANGKTCHEKLGRTGDIDLNEARRRAKTRKAEIFLQLSSGIEPRSIASTKPVQTTLDQYYESDYKPFIKQRNRSWKSTDGVYRRYVKPIFGARNFSEISRKMVIDFHADLKQRGLSGATADHGLKCLRHIINTAILNNVATDNPARNVPLFNEFNEVSRALSQEELQRLLSALHKSKSPVALIARMLMATTCRLSEILSATWKNCDLDKRVLYIDSQNSKSKKPRAVPINDAAMEVLKQLDTQGKYEYLFISPRSKSRYYSVQKAWNKLRIQAGIPGLRLHDLRHFGASELASRGVSIYSISKLLGHRDVVTSERYSHVSQSAIRELSDELSTVINAAMPESP